MSAEPQRAEGRVANAAWRTWPLLTLRQRLGYVPGIALLLCGGAWLGLAPFAPATDGARSFVLAISPVLLVLPAIPMLVLGGSLWVRVEHGRLEVVRRRLFATSPPIVVHYTPGSLSLDLRPFTGRLRGFARLVACQPSGDTELVVQASLPALRRIVDELGPLLTAPPERSD